MAPISRIAAVKQFFNADTIRPVENAEMMTFWKSLSDDEKKEFSESAARQLGIEIAQTVSA